MNPLGVVVKYVPMFLFTLFISGQGHRIFLHHVNSYHTAWNKQTQAPTSFILFSSSLLDLNPNITWNTIGGHEEWDDDDENTGDEEDDTEADDDTATSLLLDLGSR